VEFLVVEVDVCLEIEHAELAGPRERVSRNGVALAPLERDVLAGEDLERQRHPLPPQRWIRRAGP
jgi:hypothetical protein